MRLFNSPVAQILLGVMLSLSISAWGLDMNCPATIDTQEKLVKPPKGWEFLSNKPNESYRFAGLGLYDGRPSERVLLKPDNADTASDSPLYWSLVGKTWLVCNYAGTAATLARPLPKGLQHCRMASDPDKIICK